MLSLSLIAATAVAGKPPPPPPPALQLAPAFGDWMVLQQAPAAATVYGTINASGSPSVSLAISGGQSPYTVTATVTPGTNGEPATWIAKLKPTPKGGDYTVMITSGSYSANFTHATFGDVWYCAGQSNMALPMVHTISRNFSRDAILSGKYANLRIHGLSGNMNPTQPWMTVKDALTDAMSDEDAAQLRAAQLKEISGVDSPYHTAVSGGCNVSVQGYDCSMLMSFSSTCYYFGESLIDALGDDAPPIGLIHTAWGGSQIEQWLDNASIAECNDVKRGSSDASFHETRVLPYAQMAIKGWTWYQGENDMHNYFGNSMLETGYSCLMPKLVSSWRKLWSAVDGTTDPNAPFGLATLAPSGGEGGADIGTMRWAQTAGYGVVPNPALPNTFLAQVFDLNDPFSNISCYHLQCCPNNFNPNNTKAHCAGCSGEGPLKSYCDSLEGTNYYMGPIHPRDKKPVGVRLAQSAAVQAYNQPGQVTGPTISGCSVSGGKITVKFNTTLLGSDTVEVQKYAVNNSRMQVLVNRSEFCMQTGGMALADGNSNNLGGRGTMCWDDGTGKMINASENWEGDWVMVNVAAGSTPNTIEVDLTNSGGVAYAIQYGWVGDCCDNRPPTSEPCPIASCPLMGTSSKFPANPFKAKIVNNKCECIAPQVCDE